VFRTGVVCLDWRSRKQRIHLRNCSPHILRRHKGLSNALRGFLLLDRWPMGVRIFDGAPWTSPPPRRLLCASCCMGMLP
jgi:hypothetical protein